MRTSYIFVLLALTLSACGRYYHVVHNFDAAQANRILIDESYTIYIHEVFKDVAPGKEGYVLSDKATPETDSTGLIEVEYLLYSPTTKNVIYITTIPDKYQLYYSKHRLGRNILNVYDFNVFHFGKLQNTDEVVFRAKKGDQQVIWEIRPAENSLELKRIVEMLNQEVQNEITIPLALNDPIVFQKLNAPAIVLHNYRKPSETWQLADQAIYFTPKICSGKRGCKYSLYFVFKEKQDTQTFTTVKFKDIRVKYSPATLAPSP